jgi:hypothetical protein
MTRPTDPWADPGQTYPYARSGHTQALPVVQPRRTRTRLILAIGLVVAVLAGVGTYVGASVWYGWSITEPEEALPSDSATMARLDLSPGLGQRLALGRIAQKFPHDGDGRDIADQLKRTFLGLDADTFDREVRPWLGDRIASAAWSTTGDSTGACTLAALASKDDGIAEASLQRIQRKEGADAFGFVSHNGYMLVARCGAGSQAAAESARNRASTRSLAALPAFRQALSELPGHHAALAWADLALTRTIQGGRNPFVVAGITLPTDARVGQLIAGLEATGQGLDLHYRLAGSGTPQATVDVLPRLAGLPGNTVIGASTDLGASTVVTQLGQSVSSALAGGPLAALGGGLATALGSVLTLSVTTPAAGSDELPWRLVTDTGAPERAAAVALGFGLPALLTKVKVDVHGTTVTATSRGYEAGGGTLGDSPTYKAAMGSFPGRPAAAAFVHVEALLPTLRLTGAEAANLKPIQAVGLVTGDDGGTLAGLVRLLIP